MLGVFWVAQGHSGQDSHVAPLPTFPPLMSVRGQNQDPLGKVSLPEDVYIFSRLWALHGQLRGDSYGWGREAMALHRDVSVCE